MCSKTKLTKLSLGWKGKQGGGLSGRKRDGKIFEKHEGSKETEIGKGEETKILRSRKRPIRMKKNV